jgi:transposase-like protein
MSLPSNLYHHYRFSAEIISMVITINGQQYYLWRAVDPADNVPGILIQSRQDTKATDQFFPKPLKKQGFVFRAIVPDKLTSYGAAKNQILKGMEHRQRKRLNHRAENPQQLTRVPERRMQRRKPLEQVQRFLSASGLTHLNRTFNGFGCFCRTKDPAKTTNCVSPEPLSSSDSTFILSNTNSQLRSIAK